METRSDGATFTEEWFWAGQLSSVGVVGLFVVDVDADGNPEIIHTLSGGRWYVWSCRPGYCHQEWASLPMDPSITAMALAQIDGDDALEVVLGAEDVVLVFDGASHELDATMATALSWINGLAVVDVDGDGDLELVVCGDDATLAYDLVTGELERQNLEHGGVDLVLGQVDGDPALEIALARSSLVPVVVLDGASFAVQWQDPIDQGATVRLADVDGDSRDELFGVSPLRAWDLAIPQLLWQQSGGDPMHVADVDGDGTLEMVNRGAYWIYGRDASSGALEWTMNWDFGVGRFAVGETSLGGGQKLVVGAGSSLAVVDGASRTLEWRQSELSGPYLGLDWGDVDGDGRLELLSTSPMPRGQLVVHDLVTRELEYVHDVGSSYPSDGIYRVRAVQADDDARLEICFTTDFGGLRGGLSCLDGATHHEQWHVEPADDVLFVSLEARDLDGDGLEELVAGGGPYVYAYESRTGWLRWRTPDLGIGFWFAPLLRIAELDGDPAMEVVAANGGSRLAIIDGATGALDLPAVELNATSLAPHDLDGDGVEELAVGTADGEIAVVDPETGAVTSSVALGLGAIRGLTPVDLTGDRVTDWIFAARDHLYVLDGASLELLADSGPLAGSVEVVVADRDSLVAGDPDVDGRLEVLANVRVGLLLVEVTASSLFSDDFEVGDLSAWSACQP